MHKNNYDVIVQVQKGLLIKNDFLNFIHLFVANDKLQVVKELSDMMPKGAVLAIDARSTQTDGSFFTIKCSKFLSLARVSEIVANYCEENEIRLNKE